MSHVGDWIPIGKNRVVAFFRSGPTSVWQGRTRRMDRGLQAGNLTMRRTPWGVWDVPQTSRPVVVGYHM